jgi:hypothetical protein
MSGAIWVVEQGSYSDYRVVGVFSTERNAKLIADAINAARDYGDKATVEQWALDPAVEDLNAGRRRWRVLMRRDGLVESVTQNDSLYDVNEQVHIWWREKAPAYQGKGVPNVLEATVWASDAEHAIKITAEHRARMIAMGEWPETDLDRRLVPALYPAQQMGEGE